MASTSFSGRAAWTIDTESLRITVLQSGGHIAEIILKQGEHINPLWVQSRATIDSDTYDPGIHGTLYGTNAESRLLSGLAGHNLCFPFWGDPSTSEFAAGMTFHGEANIRRWELVEESRNGVTIEVVLPDSAIKLQRQFRSSGHALHCDSKAINLSSWDRPFGWCEHVTMGPPFVESDSTRFDASLREGFITGDIAGPKFAWPEGLTLSPALRGFDLTTFSKNSHKDFVNSFMVEPSREWGFFAAFQPRFALLFGYVFRRAEFPWLNVWENNDEQLQTRAMEFSNTPHHGTMKKLISSARVGDVPAYEWLDARSTVSKQFIAFIHPVPRDFCGTADVQVLGDVVEITERTRARVFQVPI